MGKSMIELVVGNLEEKRVYRQCMKRVNSLPKDYRSAFKKIQNYMYHINTVSCDMTMFTELLEFFESSVAQEKELVDVLGSDLGAFCDDLIRVSTYHVITTRDKLNQEIAEYFRREEA